MLINKTFKVRLYPNKEQEEKLSHILDGTRWIFNHYLGQRKDHYLENKKTIPYAAMARDLTQLRHKEIWLSDIQAEPLQQSLRRLDAAYNRFFRKTNAFPRFKSRFDSRQSFQKHQDWKVKENKIQIQEDLVVKYRGTIEDDAELGTLVVIRESNKWYAAITAKVEHKTAKRFNKPLGLDLGVKTLAVLSNGKSFPNIRPLDSEIAALGKLQNSFNARKKGSSRYEKDKLRIANLHKKIRNRRENYLHNISRNIVDLRPALLAVEDLNVKCMTKNRKLARVISDASFSSLLQKLEYKQKWNGGKFVKVDRFFPSSKTCHKCGYIKQDLSLMCRKWKCVCGAVHDRDINAAKNILAVSIKS